MFLGGFIFFNFNQEIDFENLIAATIVAGFIEELYFRGFLFGQLFRNTEIGFFPSIILGALIFAFGHLYQNQNVNELIGMNLSWNLFDVSNNALGGISANIFRALTILTAIILTIVLKKRRKEPYEINRKTLIMKQRKSM